MSWQAVTWVLEQSLSELGSRLVLLSIASHANREGLSAFPSLDTITRETLMSRREVIYCVQTLEEAGELHVDRGGGRGNPNSYSLPYVKGWLERVQSLHSLADRKGATKARKGAICNTMQDLHTSQAVDKQEDGKNGCTVTVKGKNKEQYFLGVSSNLSFPERSKPEELKAKIEQQKAILRQRGFLQ